MSSLGHALKCFIVVRLLLDASDRNPIQTSLGTKGNLLAHIAGKDPGIALRYKVKTAAKASRLAPGTWCLVLSSLRLFVCCPHYLVLQTVLLWILGNTASGSPAEPVKEWSSSNFCTSSPRKYWPSSHHLISTSCQSVSTQLLLPSDSPYLFSFYLFICLPFPSPPEYNLHERRCFACFVRCCSCSALAQ